MILDSHADLSIAEIVFYAPALCLSVLICFRQGFTKNLGWFYLVTLSILRLIGSSTTLYIVTKNDLSVSLLETSAITNAIGTAPLLLVLLGFLERINQRMDQKGLGLVVFRPIHLLSLGAFILAIVGGVERADAGSYNTGKACLEAASIIFLANWIMLAAIAIFTAMHKTHIQPSEHALSLASIIVLPSLLVRVLYTVLISFGNPASIFNFLTPNIWVQAFMKFLMEVLCVSVYMWAGLSSLKQTPIESKSRIDGDVVESGGYVPSEKSHRRNRRQERSLGHYRPSRLIRNAMQ